MPKPASQPAGTGAQARRLDRLEWGVCLGATLLAVWLHLVKLFSAGALWRDEAGGVGLATLPSLHEMWQMIPRDAFPVLFPSLVRLWCGMFGNTDFGLRALGCVIGLSILGLLWWNAHVMGVKKPFFALGLFAVNATLVQWGDVLRGYGLGIVFILLTVGLVWRVVRQPMPSRFVWASLAAILSVQSLFQNAFLLAAICGGAALVNLRRYGAKTAFVTLLIGLPAALSLLPYAAPLQAAQRWWVVAKVGFKPQLAWNSFAGALDSPPLLGTFIWIGLFLLGAGVGFAVLERRVSRNEDASSDLPLFAAVSSVLGVFGFFLFLWNAGLPSQPWYWLPALALAAVLMDAALAKFMAKYRTGRMVFIGILVCVSVPATALQVRQRHTNIDVIARDLTAKADKRDLILVYPWYCGVSFNRYYRGPADWLTLPPLEDYRLHRYDLLKEKLAAHEPIQPVLDRIRHTLIAGGNVWLVGDLPGPEPGETTVPTLPPAPDGPMGWFDEPYSYVWGRQGFDVVQRHAFELTVVLTNLSGHVSSYEDLSLKRARGH